MVDEVAPLYVLQREKGAETHGPVLDCATGRVEIGKRLTLCRVDRLCASLLTVRGEQR